MEIAISLKKNVHYEFDEFLNELILTRIDQSRTHGKSSYSWDNVDCSVELPIWRAMDRIFLIWAFGAAFRMLLNTMFSADFTASPVLFDAPTGVRACCSISVDRRCRKRTRAYDRKRIVKHQLKTKSRLSMLSAECDHFRKAETLRKCIDKIATFKTFETLLAPMVPFDIRRRNEKSIFFQ